MKKLSYLFLIISFFSCQEKSKLKVNLHTIKVVEAHGYVVPQDTIKQPKTISAGNPTIVKAGNPKVTLTNLNIHPAGIPTIVNAGKPRICTPGQNTFLLPKTVPAIDNSFLAGTPETVIAKDMANKDQNSQNFSTYGKLQGLKHGTIGSMLQDKSGNLWFGTDGGLSKYDGKSFSTFTDKEGLANNTVWSILEDKSGNLWFGTYGGVSKYDGKSFSTFTDKEGLANNTVLSMLEDKSGNLWFGTDGGGISKYDGKSFSTFTVKEGIASNTVKSILEDKSGNLWFGTDSGVSKYDGKSFSMFTDKEGLANNTVLSMLEDKSGNIWFGTDGGISKYDGKSFSTFTYKEGLVNNTVKRILEDKSGNIWVGTDGGVSKYDGKSFSTFTDKEGLANNKVLSILEDKSGNIWFGTDGGVSKYDGKSFSMFTDKEGLANNSVWSILEDKSGNLWLGTYGGGVSKYDGKSFSTFTDKEGLANNTVRSILQDKSGNLWFGTYGGGVSKYDGNRVEAIEAAEKRGEIIPQRMQQDLKKTNGKLVKTFITFTDKEGLANNTVTSMLEDKSGNLWFGTYGGGVSKYDGNRVEAIEAAEKRGDIIPQRTQQGLKKINGKLVKSFTTFTDKEGLANNTVLSMLEDKSGNLWFGTYGGGVSKYDGKSFITFTDKEGLANNTVLSMLEDKSGNLWFGTRFGLSKLTIGKLVEINEKVKSKTLTEQDIIFKKYTNTDGFLGIGVNGGKTMLQAKDGTIWIGANDRLTAMHPENMPPDTMAPNIQLTTIELFNENIDWSNLLKTSIPLSLNKDTTITLGNGVNVSNFNFDGLTKWHSLPQNLSLAYNNNYLTFNFIGITMNQPKNVKYQYKLDGIDENWSAITNKTSAPYGNLPHGTYTFKVKAMNSEGYWSKPFEYKFIICPPFWQTWWFRALIGLLIVGSIWYYIKSREKKLVAEKQKLEKTVEERTEELVQKNIVVEQQKHIVEEKQKEILDSINYAKRIQYSLLASNKLLNENLPNHFLFFKPKDVVSGDFYWGASIGSATNRKFILVTADSTGHGVPGAIMSMLNISCLNEAINADKLIQPADILNATRRKVIEHLSNDGSEEGGKDGMDCSLVNFDFINKKLTYAAANNPVWIIRASSSSAPATFISLAADRMPIGKHDKDKTPFTQHQFGLHSGDMVYTLTDGFADQFGGAKGKKFKYKQLEELLLSIAHESMEIQKQKLDQVFENWKGGLEQVDDVCVIGIRV